MKYDIIINEKGGTALASDCEAMGDTIRNILKDQVRSLHFASGKDIATTLDAVLKTKPEAVLIGGGDGTIVLCGSTCMKKGVPFGIIPLGTMNLLANDLNIPIPLEDCLNSYRTGVIKQIDAGSVNGQPFFCNAIIGVVPEAAIARENMRDLPSIGTWKALAETILEDMGSDKHETVHVKIGRRQRVIKAKSIIVSNNAYTQSPSKATERLARDSLRDGKLVVYTASPKNLRESFRLLLRLITGNWQKDPSIKSFSCRELLMDKASQEILLSIDGEPIPMQLPLQFRVMPKATKIVVPA